MVVVDEWHRRGVGRHLLVRLAERVDEEGISCFSALIADGNVVTSVSEGAVPVAALITDPDRADHLLPVPCFA